jgi:Ca2+:H+ antiporter
VRRVLFMLQSDKDTRLYALQNGTCCARYTPVQRLSGKTNGGLSRRCIGKMGRHQKPFRHRFRTRVTHRLLAHPPDEVLRLLVLPVARLYNLLANPSHFSIQLSTHPPLPPPPSTMLDAIRARFSSSAPRADSAVAHRPESTLVASARAIATSSWLNVLLVFIPVSWALHYAKPDDDVMIFVCECSCQFSHSCTCCSHLSTVSFIAIIPLAQLLGFATEELSMRVGQTLAGLLNATLGNAVELIVAIIALLKCELRVVQSSLIGSILSNLLLVLGMCFFAGGTRFSEQGFSLGAASINSSLLILSAVAVLLPAMLFFAATSASTNAPSVADTRADILKISHGAALLLLGVYVCYLVFQLRSHAYVYEDTNNPEVVRSLKYGERRHSSSPSLSSSTNVADESTKPILRRATPVLGSDVEATPSPAAATEEEEGETPSISVLATVLLLIAVTVLVALTSEFLVESIDGMSTKAHINKEFIGLILLPIVGNAAEHATAVTVSVKDKLTLSIGVAVGSSIQIALFVIPFIVTLGWAVGRPLTMYFDPFESAALFLAVVTVNYVIADGKSNWLEGMILMILYVLIGTCVFFYSGELLFLPVDAARFSDPSSQVLRRY